MADLPEKLVVRLTAWLGSPPKVYTAGAKEESNVSGWAAKRLLTRRTQGITEERQKHYER
jgi:hypothetical protein